MIEEEIKKDFLFPHHRTRLKHHDIPQSYLSAYMTPRGFDFPRLFNDDFFLAIRLTYNNKHYVSCTKLLVSFLDTVAYLAFGDAPKNFQQFLDKYADLSTIAVASEELWEFRNALLHMTNNESRKVNQGSVRRLLSMWGDCLLRSRENRAGRCTSIWWT